MPHFRSYFDLANDLREWIPHLPPLRAVSGVPRSGIIPATMLAMDLHIPFVPLEILLAGTDPFRASCSRELNATDGKVLVLDDTCWEGRTVKELRPLLADRPDVLVGAVYVNPKNVHKVDVAGYTLAEAWHSFQWNLFRDCNTMSCATDMDGVLCEDWTLPDDGPEWGRKYESWLPEAKPKYLPQTGGADWPLRAIVTARLHQYTDVTNAWLDRHGVKRREIVTAPYATPAERAAKGGFAKRKAEIYGHLSRKPQPARWFVESDPAQAAEIAQRTGLPVIDFHNMRGLNCADPVPLFRGNGR